MPSRGEVSNDEVNKLPFAVGLVVAFVLIILNVTVVGFCIVKRSKNKFKGELAYLPESSYSLSRMLGGMVDHFPSNSHYTGCFGSRLLYISFGYNQGIIKKISDQHISYIDYLRDNFFLNRIKTNFFQWWEWAVF